MSTFGILLPIEYLQYHWNQPNGSSLNIQPFSIQCSLESPALTNNQISLSIKKKELLLGTWQGIYLFEHRIESQVRKIIHHFIGD